MRSPSVFGMTGLAAILFEKQAKIDSNRPGLKVRQERKKDTFTMESLILAQDER